MRELAGFVLTYVGNSVWQVPLVFVAGWVAARMVRRLGIVQEHRVWCGALLLAVVLPAAAVDVRALTAEAMAALIARFAEGVVATGRVTVTMAGSYADGAVHLSTWWMKVALGAYAVLVLYFAVRLMGGLWGMRRLRSRVSAEAVEAGLRASWERYRASFRLEGSEIAVVSHAAVPMTVGVVRRMLLLPATWPAAIQSEDVDAAIAHEFAHMQRRDYAKNLLYQLLTLPIAYHPATWLLKARVVETREMVCDAMAAEAVAGRERYARSLLRLAENLVQGMRRQNLYAIGIFDANNFERRVMNLTVQQMEAGRARRMVIAVACVVLGVGTSASAMMLRMQVATPAAQSASVTQDVQGASKAKTLLTTPSGPRDLVVAVPHDASKKRPDTFVLELTKDEEAKVTTTPEGVRMLRLAPDTVPQETGAREVSSGIMAGQILSKVTPVYPQEAKDGKISGSVVMKALIGKDGTIRDLQVLSGPNELQRSAVDAVKQWVYRPYLLNGEPTEVETTITVTYTLAG